MLKKANLFVLVLVVFFYAAGCAREGVPVPESGVVKAPGGKPPTAIPAKAAWELEWEKTLAEGRKEGAVVIYNIFEPTIREAIRKDFKDKYNIELEFVTGRGSELIARVRREREAGLYIQDILMGGPTTCLTFKEAGFMDPIETMIILPEVKEPKAWLDGKFHFFDKDRYTMAYLITFDTTWIINTEMVKPEEVSSYRDLLNPKWKGKMTLLDPTVTGAGSSFIGNYAWEIMGEDYVRALAKQEPVIIRDMRLHVESVARGKYPIGLAADPDVLLSFKRAGAPLMKIIPVEGGGKLSGAGGLGVFNKQAHTNATKVFINWLLSREGQTVMGKAQGAASRRVDVPTDHVDPDRLLKPGLRYVDADTEENIRFRGERQVLAREIFGIR